MAEMDGTEEGVQGGEKYMGAVYIGGEVLERSGLAIGESNHEINRVRNWRGKRLEPFVEEISERKQKKNTGRFGGMWKKQGHQLRRTNLAMVAGWLASGTGAQLIHTKIETNTHVKRGQ